MLFNTRLHTSVHKMTFIVHWKAYSTQSVIAKLVSQDDIYGGLFQLCEVDFADTGRATKSAENQFDAVFACEDCKSVPSPSSPPPSPSSPPDHRLATSMQCQQMAEVQSKEDNGIKGKTRIEKKQGEEIRKEKNRNETAMLVLRVTERKPRPPHGCMNHSTAQVRIWIASVCNFAKVGCVLINSQHHSTSILCFKHYVLPLPQDLAEVHVCIACGLGKHS